MGLSERVALLAAQRIHLLVVTAPGWDLLRMQLQAAIRRRGWILALTPADADVLVTVGAPGDDMRTLIDAAWAQLPSPRWRADVRREDEIEEVLRATVAALSDVEGHRRYPPASPSANAESAKPKHDHDHDHDHEQESGHGHGHGHEHEHEHEREHDQDHGPELGAPPGTDDTHGHHMGGMHDGHDMSGGDASHDMGAMDHSHGHGMDMSMEGPGGIPLASGFGDDRDGLEMDVLHLPLGPVLSGWPAGLVLECTISGDVVVDADARVLTAAAIPSVPSLPGNGLVLARHLDAAVQILRTAGWDGAAEQGTRALDVIVTGAPPASVRSAVSKLGRRVNRSWLLRWSLAERRRLTPPAGVRSRLVAHLAAALAIAEGGVPAPIDQVEPGMLAVAVRGRTLAHARLLVAGVEVQPTGAVVQHA